jgi:hypothetical protein
MSVPMSSTSTPTKSQKKKKMPSKSASRLPTSSTSSANTQIKHRATPLAQHHPRNLPPRIERRLRPPRHCPKYSNHASRSDATACAASPAQVFNAPEDEYDEREDDDSDSDSDADEESEEDAENALEEHVTASDVLDVVRKYSNHASRSDATACAASSAQALNAPEDEYDEREDGDSDADEQSEEDAENELEELVTSLSISPKSPSHSDNTACSTSSKSMSHSDTTACAVPPAQALSVTGQSGTDDPDDEDNSDDDPDDDPDDPKNEQEVGRLEETTACAASPAQALPRDVVRGQNPNHRSPSDRTDCAPLPRASTSSTAQSAAPQKPKPDVDGLIWHPHPGYPNQEVSEPDAQGRVRYKIHMTTAPSQLPSRETDARRAAELIYRSVIKKYGNP